VIHERALKSIRLEHLVDSLKGKIVVLNAASAAYSESLERELSLEREKVKLNQELTAHQRLISDSYLQQSEHYRKQSRKRMWQRNGLVLILVVVVGLSL
jgi:hypothetical protein